MSTVDGCRQVDNSDRIAQKDEAILAKSCSLDWGIPCFLYFIRSRSLLLCPSSPRQMHGGPKRPILPCGVVSCISITKEQNCKNEGLYLDAAVRSRCAEPHRSAQIHREQGSRPSDRTHLLRHRNRGITAINVRGYSIGHLLAGSFISTRVCIEPTVPQRRIRRATPPAVARARGTRQKGTYGNPTRLEIGKCNGAGQVRLATGQHSLASPIDGEIGSSCTESTGL